MVVLLSLALFFLLINGDACVSLVGDAVTTPAPKVCGTKIPFDDAFRRKLVEFHNKLRGDIVKGKAANVTGNLPSANNMYALKYDCKMEKELQVKLKSCDMAKIMYTNGYGQNIVKFNEKNFATIKKPEERVLIALELWTSPISYYGLRSSGNMLVYDDARLHTFANMIYAKALRFACGYIKCRDDVHISCIYNLVGGYPGSELYEIGSGCSSDGDCTTYAASRCDKSTGLCTYSGKVPRPGGGKNTLCKGNDEMDDLSRDTILNAHNVRRSLLARGQIRNGKSNEKLPTSKFMPKMIYDCNIESMAIKYASECSFAKSDKNDRKKQNYGENVFAYPIPNADPVPAFEKAAEKWWSQITTDTIDRDVKFTESLKTKAVDQTAFTQMAWGRSVKLGCAIQTCSLSSFIVCRYSPAGNIVNEKIYETGYICSGCSSACNSTEGLCKLYGYMA